MQISPIKNPNFEKPSRNLSNRTKVKIFKKKIFWISLKKKFGSAYAQHAIKSLRMLTHAIIFENDSKIPNKIAIFA